MSAIIWLIDPTYCVINVIVYYLFSLIFLWWDIFLKKHDITIIWIFQFDWSNPLPCQIKLNKRSLEIKRIEKIVYLNHCGNDDFQGVKMSVWITYDDQLFKKYWNIHKFVYQFIYFVQTEN